MKLKTYFRAATFIVLSLIAQENSVLAKPKTVGIVKKVKIIPALIIIPMVLFGVWRVTHRSGVNHKIINRHLPGDDIVPDANWVINRSAILDAPIDKVWPWIQQLGRNRAGWYATNRVESIYGRHALHTIDTAYQHVKKATF